MEETLIVELLLGLLTLLTTVGLTLGGFLRRELRESNALGVRTATELSAHQKTCSERMENIYTMFTELRHAQEAARQEVKVDIREVHGRINDIAQQRSGSAVS